MRNGCLFTPLRSSLQLTLLVLDDIPARPPLSPPVSREDKRNRCSIEHQMRVYSGEYFCSFNKQSGSFTLFEGKIGVGSSPYQTSMTYQASDLDDMVLFQLRTWLLEHEIEADVEQTLYMERYVCISGMKQEQLSPMISEVKEEVEMQETPRTKKVRRTADEDFLYMKALFHALPMDYVTVAKLRSKLGGEANQTTVRKLLDKMIRDGFLANSDNRRLSKHVVHSESSNKKLLEVKKVLENKPVDMEIDTNGKPFEFNGTDIHSNGQVRDGSTFGGLHSIGSDLMRTRL